MKSLRIVSWFVSFLRTRKSHYAIPKTHKRSWKSLVPACISICSSIYSKVRLESSAKHNDPAINAKGLFKSLNNFILTDVRTKAGYLYKSESNKMSYMWIVQRFKWLFKWQMMEPLSVNRQFYFYFCFKKFRFYSDTLLDY